MGFVLYIYICFVAFFGRFCFLLLLNASFSTDMVWVQIENKIMAQRYIHKTNNQQQQKTLRDRATHTHILTNITDAHIQTEWKKKQQQHSTTLTFWLINYAHIQINTLLAMSHKKSVEKTVTLNSIWMWIMLFMTHDKIVCVFFCSVYHHSNYVSFIYFKPFHLTKSSRCVRKKRRELTQH